MSDLKSVITLLQLVLALLQAPGAMDNPQTKVLYNLAMQEAGIALSQPVDTNTVAQVQLDAPIQEPTTTLGAIQVTGLDGGNRETTGVLDTDLCVILFDQNGNPLSGVPAIITTDSSPNQKDQNGNLIPQSNSFANANQMCSYKVDGKYGQTMGYDFGYMAPSDGEHVITVEALGTTTTTIITSQLDRK